jgi:hypothetical protein
VKVEELRGYGLSFSDAESSWSPAMGRWLKRVGARTVLESLSFGEKMRFALRLAAERRRIARVDIDDIRARGMTNERFLATQREYVGLFAALRATVGRERALAIGNRIMDRTAARAFEPCFPAPQDLARFDDPLEAFRAWFAPAPEASRRAGSNEMVVVDAGPDGFGWDITRCVWLDLAERWGAPEACLPNCYADDVTFPGYFRAFGLEYSRTGTLARGDSCCDFRLRRAR